MEKLGIINLLVVIKGALEIQAVLTDIFSDKKFQFQEVFKIMPALSAGQEIVEKADLALAEFKDLDESEKVLIFEQIEEFDIKDDEKEAKIESAIKFAVETSQFIFSMKS